MMLGSLMGSHERRQHIVQVPAHNQLRERCEAHAREDDAAPRKLLVAALHRLLTHHDHFATPSGIALKWGGRARPILARRFRCLIDLRKLFFAVGRHGGGACHSFRACHGTECIP